MIKTFSNFSDLLAFAKSHLYFERGYFLEDFRKIRSYFPEDFRKIRSYFPEYSGKSKLNVDNHHHLPSTFSSTFSLIEAGKQVDGKRTAGVKISLKVHKEMNQAI